MTDPPASRSGWAASADELWVAHQQILHDRAHTSRVVPQVVRSA